MRISSQATLQLLRAEMSAAHPQIDPRVLEQALLRELARAGMLDLIAPGNQSAAAQAIGAAQPVGQVQAPQAAQPVTQSTSMGRAQQTIQTERARCEREKYTFTDKQRADVDAFNAKREQKNAPLRAKVAGVEQEMQAVAADPKLSEAKRAKKLAQLQKKRDKIQAQIKPPIVLEQVTAEVDAIASDDKLTKKEKEKRIGELRKKYGLPKNKGFMGMNGPVNMHDMFTGRLGGIYKRSKGRLDAAAKAHKQEMNAQLEVIKKTYGDKSIAYLQAKAEVDDVGKVYQAESRRLGELGKFLTDMYRPKSFWEKFKSFFKKMFKWVGKILNFVMPFVKFIPVVGQIIGAAWAGVKTIANLVRGNWKGAIGSLLGALPGVGGVVGKVAGWVNKGVKLVKGGINTVKSLVRGDVAGALGGAASIAGGAGAGDVASVLNHTARGAGAVQSLARGDVAGALQNASGLAGAAGNGQVADVLGHAAGAASTVQRAAQGDVLGSLSEGYSRYGEHLPAPVHELGRRVGEVRNEVERVVDQIDDQLTQQLNQGIYALLPSK